MTHRIARAFVTLVALAATAMLTVLTPTAQAAPEEYAFTEILDGGTDWVEFGCPALNDRGQVAVRGQRESGAERILRGSGGPLTVIAKDSRGITFLGRNPSINDRGDVSFAAGLRGASEAIYRGRGGELVEIANTEPGRFNFFGFDTSINDQRRVAFKAELDNFDEGLFSGRGEGVRTHYLASTSPFQGDDSGPSYNDVSEIAFVEFVDDDGTGIFVVTPDDEFIEIATDEGPIGFLGDPSLNNLGQVAFHAFFDEGGEAILMGDGGPLTTVADTTGPFESFGFGGPSLNVHGDVAFTAALDGSFETGLYVGPDPEADRVIGPGDPLDGSVVTNVVACNEALNDHGELAFFAQLEDGRMVVYRATPR